jgi:uncharacterized membrane protein
MNTHDEEEIKKEFQLERVVLFSDAVFAIIITLMVIEMKLPETLRHANAKEVHEAFIELIPKFGAYVLSFFLIGNFWLRHLRIFSFLKDYNTRLIILNLAFLFFISLFPFCASLISINVHMMYYSWGFTIYFGVVCFMILSQTFLVGYLIKNKTTLCIKVNEIEDVLEWKLLRLNFVFIPAVLILVAVIVKFSWPAQIVVYTFSAYGAMVGILKKKFYPKQNSDTPMLMRLFRSRVGKRVKSKPIADKPEVVEG